MFDDIDVLDTCTGHNLLAPIGAGDRHLSSFLLLRDHDRHIRLRYMLYDLTKFIVSPDAAKRAILENLRVAGPSPTRVGPGNYVRAEVGNQDTQLGRTSA